MFIQLIAWKRKYGQTDVQQRTHRQKHEIITRCHDHVEGYKNEMAERQIVHTLIKMLYIFYSGSTLLAQMFA